MWELVIVWTSDGSKEIHTYNDEDTAEARMRGFQMAFGNQVWCCVRHA